MKQKRFSRQVIFLLHRARRPAISLLTGMLVIVGTNHVMSEDASTDDRRKKAQQDQKDGNFDDAYREFRVLVLDPRNDPRLVGHDLTLGVRCLRRLGRRNEIDEFVESAVKVHEENWRLLQAAAQIYQHSQHLGFMVAGKFERGGHRGGGKLVNSLERDRVRSLQLMAQAVPRVRQDDGRNEVADFFFQFADMMLYSRGHHDAWRLQYLTDLDQLPDYDEGHPYFRPYPGAPVDPDGQPVFHYSVKRWQDAETDGQRWRWALDQVVEYAPRQLDLVRMQRAQFYQQQFGVATMSQYGWFFGRSESGDGDEDESGTYALHTLGENETIAKMATGIKRFEMPDEFNFIKIFRTRTT